MKKCKYYVTSTALISLLALKAAADPLAEDGPYTITGSIVGSNGGNLIDGNDTLTVSSSGQLSNTGFGARAVDLSGGSNTVTVTGTVSATGTLARAVHVEDSTNTLNISGNISNSGTSSVGIYILGGTNNRLTFDGVLNSTGVNAGGIIATASGGGSSSNINIGGRIHTDDGDGVLLQWSNHTLEVSGTIDIGGTRTAIQIDGSDNNVILSGNIFAGNSLAAVWVYETAGVRTGENNTIRFREGVRIVGDIILTDGNDTSGNTLRFDVGSAQSYVFATTGSWTLEDLDGRAVVEGSAMAAGIGNVETADELMFDRAFSLDNSLGRLERQSSFGERQALIDAYGFSLSRDEDGTTSAYDLDSRGMTIGLPLELLGNQAIAFVNYHDSEIDIASGTHDIDAQSLRFGLSVPQMWSGENYNIGIYAVAGRNSYDGVRDVLVNQNTTTGITTIDASWDGTELEIGADVTSNMALASKLTLDSSLGLAAQVERVGSYSEQNYFAWNGRTIVQAHAKAEVTLGYQATDTTRIYGTAGAWRRDVRSGETAHYTINNTAVSYNGGVYDDTISSLRFGLGHRLGNGAIITAEASAIDGGTTHRSYGASLGVAARF